MAAPMASGVIKRYGKDKGFGFIACEQTGSDVYFKGDQLPPDMRALVSEGSMDLSGCGVQFELIYMPDGKPQARAVVLTSFGSDDPDEAAAVAALAGDVTGGLWGGNGLGELGNETLLLSGTVKSYNGTKGYGFITCMELGSDVYFKKQELPFNFQAQDVTGLSCKFETLSMPDGKFQARKMQIKGMPKPKPAAALPAAHAFAGGGFVGGGGGGFGGAMSSGGLSSAISSALSGLGSGKGAGKGFGKGAAPAPAHLTPQKQSEIMAILEQMDPELAARTAMSVPNDTSLAGVIKRYDAAKGFGFINAPGLPDVYFKSATPFAAGAKVIFKIHWTPDGKPQGNSVAPELSGGEQATGVIKAFIERHGYGFVAVHNYGQDVYFKQEELPQELVGFGAAEMVGTEVSFDIDMTTGKPVAKNMAYVGVAGQGAKRGFGGGAASSASGLPVKRARVATDELVQGYIKSYSPANGFGFISCEAVERDIYFKKYMIPEDYHQVDLTGTPVTFQLVYSPEGKPQASQLQL